ncbi:hypothetical protein [Clavibacter capsici]|uniref:hypothetical protein n=1 Tax=Clavibacter capsici TaxID=1874630 RepID=UPI0006B1ED24|nr:hypothetical protein [Clavibacter capsici]ALD13131.1 hypothetical protein AES38_09545 [Clavibacter capsici]
MDQPPPFAHYLAKHNGDQLAAIKAMLRDQKKYQDFLDPNRPDPDDPRYKGFTRNQARAVWKAEQRINPDRPGTEAPIRARSPRKRARVDPTVTTQHTPEEEARNDGDVGEGS